MQIFVNGESRQVSGQVTVAELLAQLNLNLRHVAVELNLELVPRAEHAGRALEDGDQLEVVTLVGGG